MLFRFNATPNSMQRQCGRIVACIFEYLRNRNGNIATSFAVAIPVFLAFSGGVIDYSVALKTRSTMQAAADAAALGAARELRMANPNAQIIADVARTLPSPTLDPSPTLRSRQRQTTILLMFKCRSTRTFHRALVLFRHLALLMSRFRRAPGCAREPRLACWLWIHPLRQLLVSTRRVLERLSVRYIPTLRFSMVWL